MTENSNKYIANKRKFRTWHGLLISFLFAILAIFLSDNLIKLKDHWRYISGLIIFIFSESIILYYKYVFLKEEIVDISASLKKEILALSEKAVNEYKTNLSIIKTYSQIASSCPESIDTIFDNLLPDICHLLEDNKIWWWFLERDLHKIFEIKGWPGNGCETNHSYIEALKQFSKKTNEVCMTSVIPPALWRRRDIGYEYFNTQVDLHKSNNLSVHRIFIIKQGYDVKESDKKFVIRMHKDNGFNVDFVETNNYNEFIDFVIFKGLGVIKSDKLSSSIWNGLKQGEDIEKIWDEVKEETARFYTYKHSINKNCTETFQKFIDRYADL